MKWDSVKLTGCCTICDTEIYESRLRYRTGLLAGKISAPAEAKLGACGITFLISDGSSVRLSFCGNCADLAHKNMGKVWAKAVKSQIWYFVNAEKIYTDPGMKAPIHDAKQRVIVIQGLYHHLDTFLLEPIAVEKWGDADA